MPLSNTQKGAAGEMLVSVLAALGSDGELELFRPEYDDDHVDLVAARRGKPPKLALQVKTALALDDEGRVHAYVSSRDGLQREDPSFVYVVLWIDRFAARRVWVVPSEDFNRLAYPSTEGQVAFMAWPDRDDAAAAFRMGAPDVGNALLARMDALPADSQLPTWGPAGRRIVPVLP